MSGWDKVKALATDAKSMAVQKFGTETEKKVEEAVSNQKWGASGSVSRLPPLPSPLTSNSAQSPTPTAEECPPIRLTLFAGTLMNEIAQLTYDYQEYPVIMKASLLPTPSQLSDKSLRSTGRLQPLSRSPLSGPLKIDFLLQSPFRFGEPSSSSIFPLKKGHLSFSI